MISLNTGRLTQHLGSASVRTATSPLTPLLPFVSHAMSAVEHVNPPQTQAVSRASQQITDKRTMLVDVSARTVFSKILMIFVRVAILLALLVRLRLPVTLVFLLRTRLRALPAFVNA